MLNMLNLRKSFPKQYTPRPDQEDALKQIEAAIQSDSKYIILSAPTGTGKSLIAATFANHSNEPTQKYINLVDNNQMFQLDQYGAYVWAKEATNEKLFGTYVLTTSKTLQDQYDKLFDNSLIFKGKSNYECQVDTTCQVDAAPCLVSSKLLKECQHKKRCLYYNQRDYSTKEKFSVLNYSSFLSLPHHVRKRRFIICDEASNLEDELVKFFSVTIDYKRLKNIPNCPERLDDNFPTKDKHQNTHMWLQDIKHFLNDYLSKILSKKASLSEFTKIRYFKLLSDNILSVLDHWNECNYVIEQDGNEVTFTPLYVNTLANEIFTSGDKVILMSATIIDHKTFAKTLGIKDYSYVDIDSFFDSNKAPIYCPGIYNLNYKNIDTNLPKVVDQAIKITEHYNDMNGIIHTHSFKITEAVRKKLGNNSRYLFRAGNIYNEQILEEHFLRKDKTVLVSPSLSHGIDLIGDHGEFQVIIKLPYLPLGSKRIKALFEKDKDWYQMKMLINLVQMCGRIIRSNDDHGDTFILDGNAFKVLKQNWKNLPRWFKSRLV